MRIGAAIAEPQIAHGIKQTRSVREATVEHLLERCGLPPGSSRRYPDAFSGGQRQRIAIARALALSPRLIVADEPTSALDVSVQAQLVNLLTDLQAELGLTYLFISHNLAVLRHVSNRIAIMYGGRIVESAPAEEIFEHPEHPYTKTLLSALPVPDPESDWLAGVDVRAGESPIDPGEELGCRYASRCPLASGECWATAPPVVEIAPGHEVACWHSTAAVDVGLTSRG
jgi:oligopeptide/dipeptide ABC transporter ATP-binding protein